MCIFVRMESPQILFLSNLIIEKGVLVLLDALKILKDQGCPFTCVIVGAETAEISADRLREELRVRNIQDRVSYKGQRFGQDKETCFEQADLFVFPTFYSNECFPLVLLEAMQHHLPIVTTDEGGIPDIVKDGYNGLLCMKRHPQDLAEKIQHLLSDQQLRVGMGQNGYSRFQSYFTLDGFTHCLITIFKSLLT